MTTLGFDGTWVGQNKLWLEDPNTPELSPTRLTVDGNTVKYTWSFRGQPQSGVLVVKIGERDTTAAWTDTWHSQTEMTCIGTTQNGRVNVLGHYTAGDQLWGWRTELYSPAKDRLMIRMYNVEPDVQEQLAVEMDLARA